MSRSTSSADRVKYPHDRRRDLRLFLFSHTYKHKLATFRFRWCQVRLHRKFDTSSYNAECLCSWAFLQAMVFAIDYSIKELKRSRPCNQAITKAEAFSEVQRV